MYIVVDGDGVTVCEADNLKALSVRTNQALTAGALGSLGEPSADGAHVWLNVDALRSAARATLSSDQREAWVSGFDGMIAYATSKGWTDTHGRVRAHVEPLT